MKLFLDSSALAKRYILEDGSDRVAAHCRNATEIILSVLCIPELISGLNRLIREGKLERDLYLEIKGDFLADLRQARLIGTPTSVIEGSITCLETSVVRTLDAIHIAAAWQTGCDLFLSADRRQCAAAREVGLQVEALHP
jgi:uncharacterized protein